MRQVRLENKAFEHLIYWAKTDVKLMRKILALIKETQRTPFTGRGKPEPLKHELKGYWSRQINDEHRLVYEVTDEAIKIQNSVNNSN